MNFGLALAIGLLSAPLLPKASAASQRVAVATGESLQITTIGSGPDVVLIPGLFGSAFSFRKVIPALAAAGYRATVIEPLGVGSSSRPATADYSLTAQADRIDAAMARLQIEHAVVVAHSIAASMALRLSYRHPERVRALVSIEGGPAETVATPGFRLAMRFTPLIKLFGGERLVRGKVRGALISRSGNPTWVTDEVVRGYSAGATEDIDATLKAFSQMARSREPEALRPRLSDVHCAVRLLLGSAPHEGGPTAAEVHLLQQSLAYFTTDRVPGVGHFIFEEDPAAVLAAVQQVAGTKRVAQAQE